MTLTDMRPPQRGTGEHVEIEGMSFILRDPGLLGGGTHAGCPSQACRLRFATRSPCRFAAARPTATAYDARSVTFQPRPQDSDWTRLKWSRAAGAKHIPVLKTRLQNSAAWKSSK